VVVVGVVVTVVVVVAVGVVVVVTVGVTVGVVVTVAVVVVVVVVVVTVAVGVTLWPWGVGLVRCNTPTIYRWYREPVCRSRAQWDWLNLQPKESENMATKKTDEIDGIIRGAHVHTAICDVKTVLAQGGGITKDRKATMGAGGTYNFRGIDDVYNALCGITADKGLAMYPRVVEKQIDYQTNAKGNTQTHYHLTLEVDLVSTVDGSSHTVRSLGEAIDTGDKGSGKAQSYAMKMACLMTFMIPTHGESMDTEAFAVEVAPVAPAKRERVIAAQQQAAVVATRQAPTPPDSTTDGIDRLSDAIGSVDAFDRLMPLIADAEGSPEANILHAMLLAKAIALFGVAKDMATVQQGFDAVDALGSPDVLKTAANIAYARFR